MELQLQLLYEKGAPTELAVLSDSHIQKQCINCSSNSKYVMLYV